MTASASQGFAVGLTLMEAGRSSLWAISWAMFDATRAGLAKNVAYAGALTECRSVEELASLQATAAQDALVRGRRVRITHGRSDWALSG